MLVIRFARRGRKNQAFFHLVVAEKARAVKKQPVEKLGYYNPHTDGGKGEFVFDTDRVLHYIKNGAQMSQTAARMLTKAGVKEAGKFVEARPTKPKKTPPPTEAPVAEEPAPEAPAETPEDTAETPAPETPAAEAAEPKTEETNEAPAEAESEAKEKAAE